jgi:hypothetical protein
MMTKKMTNKKIRSDKGKAKIHGMSRPRTPEYMAWDAMIQRCTNPNRTQSKDYYGRGITVCDEWRNSFEQFYTDIGPKPTTQHQLNRIDNEKGYFPGNVEWTTPRENARNKRSNHLITYNGETLPLCDMAVKYGISERALCHRLARGKSVEEAMTTKVQEKNKTYTAFGESGTMPYFSKKYSVSIQLIRQRLKQGMSIEEALSKPVKKRKPSKSNT